MLIKQPRAPNYTRRQHCRVYWQLDGMGFAIERLNILDKTKSDCGLFGVNQGNITNLSLTNGTITGKDNVGAFAGQNKGTISNVFNRNKAFGEKNVGGIAGENAAGAAIEHTVNLGFASGDDKIGGIVGTNSGSIQYSANHGSAGGKNEQIGGISGKNGSAGTVQNVYNVGSIAGATNRGELIGDNSGNMNNAYYITTPVGNGASTGVTSTTLQNLKDFTATTGNAAGFSSSIWRFEAGKTTPMLDFAVTDAITQAAIEAPIKQADIAATIQWGCAEDPLLAIINTAADLTLDWQNLRLSDRDGLVSDKNLTINQYAGPSHYGTLGAKTLKISTVNDYRNRGKLNADQLEIAANGTLVLDMDRVNDSNGNLPTNYGTITLRAPTIKLGYTPTAEVTIQGKPAANYSNVAENPRF